jgi:hypothetical protein
MTPWPNAAVDLEAVHESSLAPNACPGAHRLSIRYSDLLATRSPEQYVALRGDIIERGIECPRIVRSRADFANEHAKRQHIVKLNLARGHTGAVRWGAELAR